MWSSSLQDRQSKGGTYDTVQIAGYVVAGVAAAGAAVCLYFGFRPERPGLASVAPLVAPNGGGLVFNGNF